MSLLSELEPLSSAELIEELSTRIYAPPLCDAYEHPLEVAVPLRVVILILEFDTEVSMNSILGFLENSTGLYFAETIEAFALIGALETTETLRAIEAILAKHDITPQRLRADLQRADVHQVTTFEKLHGDLGLMPDEVEQEAKRLYSYGDNGTGEPIWSLLAAFVDKNRAALLTEIARVAGEPCGQSE